VSARIRPPSSRCLPVREWPLPDQGAWTAALRPAGVPDRDSVAAHWSDATRRMVVGGYGRWLTWLGERSQLDPPTAPSTRVTQEQLSLYVADLRETVAAFTVAARVEQLGNAMRALAPEQHWHWLQRIADQIRAGAKAERERTQRSSLASPEGNQEPGELPSPTIPNRCLPLDEWPALDRAAWNAALQPGDVLDPGGVAIVWAITSQQLIVNGYGRWLTWLIMNGVLDPLMPPAVRVVPERLRAYAADLRATVGSFTVATRIQQLGNAMRAMAPEQNWRWILRAAGRLRARAVSVRDKRRSLQSPEKLVALGMTLMAQADDPASGRPAERAAGYRDGLLIALLAQLPMRGRNLRSILGGQHLIRRGTEWWLEFAAAETKTRRQHLEFPFPPDLVPQLQRYMEVYRPVLLARGDRQTDAPLTALWVSKQGRQMGYAAIGHQVRQRTQQAFGIALSPHRFRDCAATAIAINAPEQVRLILPILGHTTLKTSERYYNQAGSLEAGRRYSRTIAALRRLSSTSQRVADRRAGGM
jgi:integrase/recombinase XerD